jgi:hypothetical protein
MARIISHFDREQLAAAIAMTQVDRALAEFNL